MEIIAPFPGKFISGCHGDNDSKESAYSTTYEKPDVLKNVNPKCSPLSIGAETCNSFAAT